MSVHESFWLGASMETYSLTMGLDDKYQWSFNARPLGPKFDNYLEAEAYIRIMDMLADAPVDLRGKLYPWDE